MKLRTGPAANLDPDDVYAKLVRLGSDKSDRDARSAMAALALLLINHIDDVEVIDEAITMAGALPPSASPGVSR